ncbi:predicted protein [Nematostella vectensis]|uniref:Major facilitator superfamily (MFS) profile domain-containing protein n=1 Tax=Nematostella vectensis TaxID=45351 RepID=A7RIS8_NEMVE|nr:predicted protein [Nematostella vectensis]|eukprot:XP_001640625.1 predicted protein [Nematostella vectensis]
MTPSPRPISWLKNPHRAVTVEITIFFYIAGMILELPVLQQYLYERAAKELKINNTSNTTICSPNDLNSTGQSANDAVQEKASQYILAYNLALQLPAVLTACLLGTWSDKNGRKPLMLIVAFGAIVDASVALFTVYTDGPLYPLIIGGGINGVMGFYPTMVLALLAYIADTTPSKRRAIKLAVLEALAFLSGTLGHFSSGIYIHHLGYKATFWGILSLHLINFIYLLFFLPESMPKQRIEQSGKCLTLEQVKSVYMVYLKKRDGRWILCVLSLLSVFFLFAQYIVTTLGVLYGKRYPLCWSAELVGYFLGTLLCVKAFGAVLGIWLGSLMKLTNYTAAQIGTLFLIAGLTMIGFSQTTFLMFMSCVANLFSGVPQPCIRAQMSQMVGKEEQGALFAILASLESLTNFTSQLIFNPLYAWSIANVAWKYAAGIPFFVNAGIAVIPFILLGVIRCAGSTPRSGKHKSLLPEPIEENNYKCTEAGEEDKLLNPSAVQKEGCAYGATRNQNPLA